MKLRLKFAGVTALCFFGFGSAQSQEPTWVTQSPLPQGPGIASAHPLDRELKQHPAVIFADDFESGEVNQRWDEVNNKDQSALQLVEQVRGAQPLGKRSLRVTASLNKNMGGGLTQWFEPADTLYFRFYTFFDSDCDYVHHFCTLRANKSLRGGDRWSGFGGAGVKPVGDERFSTAIEPWGNWGKFPPPGRWNFYSYWHEMKPSPDGKYWGNSLTPPEQPSIPRGQWICVEMMLKHNTPGQRDGEQAYWIDGKLQGHWQGINWRTNPNLRANAFTLESYVTDRWTKQETNIVYFDNVVIAREYIGPM